MPRLGGEADGNRRYGLNTQPIFFHFKQTHTPHLTPSELNLSIYSHFVSNPDIMDMFSFSLHLRQSNYKAFDCTCKLNQLPTYETLPVTKYLVRPGEQTSGITWVFPVASFLPLVRHLLSSECPENRRCKTSRSTATGSIKFCNITD